MFAEEYEWARKCVCVCVCKRGKVLGVDCKVREANFRCGVEAGDEETVLGGDGGTRFQYNQANKTKKIIPLLYNCLIGQTFILLPY